MSNATSDTLTLEQEEQMQQNILSKSSNGYEEYRVYEFEVTK